jgi:hypothetical protein
MFWCAVQRAKASPYNIKIAPSSNQKGQSSRNQQRLGAAAKLKTKLSLLNISVKPIYMLSSTPGVGSHLLPLLLLTRMVF